MITRPCFLYVKSIFLSYTHAAQHQTPSAKTMAVKRPIPNIRGDVQQREQPTIPSPTGKAQDGTSLARCPLPSNQAWFQYLEWRKLIEPLHFEWKSTNGTKGGLKPSPLNVFITNSKQQPILESHNLLHNIIYYII